MLHRTADKIEIQKCDFSPPAHEAYPGVTNASPAVLAVPVDFPNIPQNQKWGFLLATVLSLPGSPEPALEAGEGAPPLLALPRVCPGSVLPFAPAAAGDAYGFRSHLTYSMWFMPVVAS